MFYLIKNGKITGSSSCYLIQEGFETIEKDFSTEEQGKINLGWLYINGEFIAPIKTEEEIKQEKISEYKKIEIEVIKKAEEHKNTELLPDGVLKTMKLEKVLSEKNEIEKRFNDFLENLEIEYGESIFNELI